jgi:hypothetical protein
MRLRGAAVWLLQRVTPPAKWPMRTSAPMTMR